MMAAETMKEYLVGIGFDLDEGGAAQADAALQQLDGILKNLGKVLENTATAIRELLTEFRGGKGEIDQSAAALDTASDAAQDLAESENRAAAAAGDMANANAAAASSTDQLAEKADQAAKSTEKAAKSFKKADQAAKLDNAKKGSENVSKLDDKLKQVSGTVKAFVGAAITMMLGSSLGEYIKETINFTESLGKSAKALKKSYEEARAYNTALATMGKTADEIAKDGSLKKTFNELQSLGKQLALPDAAQGLKGISEIKDGLLQLKFVGNYAMQWLMYKIQTVAEGPLAQVRDMVTGIKDWFAGNIEKVAEGMAKAFGNVVQLFMSLITAVKAVIGWIGELPPAIKIVGAVILTVIAMVKSKFALITVIVTAILLLIDDFVTYMQGGDSLFGGFWGKCVEWAEKVIPVVEKVIGWISDFLTTVWDATTSVISWLDEMGLIEPIIGGIVTAFALFKGLKLVDTIKNVVTSFQGFSSILSLLGGKTTLIIIAIGALVAAGIWLYQNWDVVKEKAAQIWSAIVEWVVGAWESIQSAWANVKEWFVEKFEAAKTGVENAWAAVVDFFVGIYDGIVSAFASVGEWFSGIFTTAREGVESTWSTVTGFFSGIWESISSNPTLSGIADVIFAPFQLGWTYIETIWNAAAAFFTGIWGLITGDATLADVLTSISQPFIDGWAKVEAIFAGVGEFFGGIWTTITDAFADAASFFQGVASNIWSGITNFTEDAGAWFSTNVWTPIKDKFNDALSFFTGIAGNVWSGITSGFESIGSWFTDNVWTPITNVFSIDGITSFFKGVATNIWDGLTGGLGEKVGSVTETVKGFFSNVWDGVLSFFGIASPSTLAKTAGENVMEGFGNGTEGKEASITEKLKGVFSNIWDGAKSVWDGVTGWLGDLFGWGDADEGKKNTAQSEVQTAAGEIASSVTDSFTDVETAISEPIVNGTTTAATAFTELQTTITTVMTAILTAISDAASGSNTSLNEVTTGMSTMSTESGTASNSMSTSFNSIVTAAKKMATGVTAAIKSLPASVQSTFTALASSMTSTFNQAASNVQSQVSKIKSSLASIPRSISVTVSAKKAFSFGGVVDHETDAKIGEDGREYVIPVTKPARAISLLRSAASELGMNVQTTKEAAAALGGRADANITPMYAAGNTSNTNTINNSTQVMAPATINVYGSNANSIANNVAKNQERLVLRNLKSALA